MGVANALPSTTKGGVDKHVRWEGLGKYHTLYLIIEYALAHTATL